MPKENIERAVKKASGTDDSENYEEIRYEGYGPGGVAVIVEALTDNRNRTASEIRSAFSKHGGTLGETGSVNFLFSRNGIIKYPISVCKADDFFDIAAESQCNDIHHDEDFHEAVCEIEKFGTVRDFLSKQLGDPLSAKLEWTAISPITIDNEKIEKLIKLMEALEENDDVQNVYTNIKITKENLHEITS